MNKYNIFIWPKSFGETFKEITDVFNEIIRNKGYECNISKNPDFSCQNIIFGANNIIQASVEIPENSIIVNLEQLSNESVWLNDKYFDLLKRHEVWDYSDVNIFHFNKRDIINIKKINIGYSPCLSTLKSLDLSNINKDIDVLFYGCMNERRINIYNLLSKNHNINVVFKNNVYGKDRDQLIARSKIVLNVHFYDSKILEIIRISHLLANNTFVISEDGGDLDINKKEYEYWNDAVIFVKYDNLVDTIIKYLKDDNSRIIQAKKGYEIILSRPQFLPIPNLKDNISNIDNKDNKDNIDSTNDINSKNSKDNKDNIDSTNDINSKDNEDNIDSTNDINSKDNEDNIDSTNDINNKDNKDNIDSTNDINSKDNEDNIDSTNDINSKDNKDNIDSTNDINSKDNKDNMDDKDNYIFYPCMDSDGYDLQHIQLSIQELKNICNKLPYAVGFNTNGWIKYNLNPFDKWIKYSPDFCSGLYVKKNVSITNQSSDILSTNQSSDISSDTSSTNQSSDISSDTSSTNQSSDTSSDTSSTNQSSDISSDTSSTNQSSDISSDTSSTNQSSDISSDTSSTNQSSSEWFTYLI